jgi:cation:H+ antiporter
MEHLIPQVWFDGLHWSVLLSVTVASMAALIKGADRLVEGASGLAYRLGIPKVIVGATIVSLGTTSPEAAVSVMAAWAGDPGLALGNAVGSVIADTALIFGVCCLFVALPADRYVLARQGWVQFGAGVALAVLCYGTFLVQKDQAALGRGIGLLLLGMLVCYLCVSVKWAREHPHGEPFQAPTDLEIRASGLHETAVVPGHPHGVVGLVGGLVVGLAIVILASRVLICSVAEVAAQAGIPSVVIAATLVALGTSLPELVVGITAIKRDHAELLVGNVIGADVLNVFFVIGASAAAAPLPIVDTASSVPRIFLYVHLPTMLLVLTLFRVFIISAVKKEHFRRWFGIPLTLIYVAYVVLQYAISRV